MINSDGSKVFMKGARVGLFHVIGSIVDGQSIGVAESYETASTCYQLSEDSPVVCAFDGNNIRAVEKALNLRYPNSPVVILGDNTSEG